MNGDEADGNCENRRQKQSTIFEGIAHSENAGSDVPAQQVH